MRTQKIANFLLGTKVGLRVIQRINLSLTWHLRRVQRDLARKISPEGKIMSGPFRGMAYGGDEDALGSSILPKMVGSYEEELHACLEDIFTRNYETVIDIGCDDGYYAVGLAKRMPSAQILAFDINSSALYRTANLAKENQLGERLTLEEGCTPEQLRHILTKSSCLILSDCEGAEDFLLHPSTLPVTAKFCDLLVESHDTPERPNMAEVLAARFSSTHDSTIFTGVPRQPQKYPCLRGLNGGETDFALNESRPFFMKWVMLRHRDIPAS